MSADRFAGHTPKPWVAYNRGIGWEIHGPNGEPLNSGFRETFSEADAKLGAKAPELLAENERLKSDLARVSVEFGLPPTIGPAPGEIARVLATCDMLRAFSGRMNEECQRLRASNQRLEVEAIQRQGESDRARLAARADIERLEARIAELEAAAKTTFPPLGTLGDRYS